MIWIPNSRALIVRTHKDPQFVETAGYLERTNIAAKSKGAASNPHQSGHSCWPKMQGTQQYLDPKSMIKNCPKPLKKSTKVTVYQTFRVQKLWKPAWYLRMLAHCPVQSCWLHALSHTGHRASTFQCSSFFRICILSIPSKTMTTPKRNENGRSRSARINKLKKPQGAMPGGVVSKQLPVYQHMERVYWLLLRQSTGVLTTMQLTHAWNSVYRVHAFPHPFRPLCKWTPCLWASYWKSEGCNRCIWGIWHYMYSCSKNADP